MDYQLLQSIVTPTEKSGPPSCNWRYADIPLYDAFRKQVVRCAQHPEKNCSYESPSLVVNIIKTGLSETHFLLRSKTKEKKTLISIYKSGLLNTVSFDRLLKRYGLLLSDDVQRWKLDPDRETIMTEVVKLHIPQYISSCSIIGLGIPTRLQREVRQHKCGLESAVKAEGILQPFTLRASYQHILLQ